MICRVMVFNIIYLLPLIASKSLAQCVVPPSGLVGWWPGDDNYDDISGNNLDGTEHGTVPFVVGEVDKAFSFDGDTANFVAIDNNIAIDVQQITVDLWFKGSAQANFNYLLSKGGEEDITPSYGLYTGNNGGLIFLVSDGSSYLLSPNAGSSYWDNAWHHAAGTYDGEFICLYVDGNTIGCNEGSIVINYDLSTHNKLLIGTYSDIPVVNGFSFIGTIDELEIFNRALSLSEIQSIYNAMSDGKCNVDVLIWAYSNDFCFSDSVEQFLPTIIYGSNAIDVTEITISSLSLNGLSVLQINGVYIYSQFDVNHDGFLDLIPSFDKLPGAFTPGDNVAALLVGNLSDGTQIRGNGEFCLH